jgi:iron-sulfur cluster assembly protein
MTVDYVKKDFSEGFEFINPNEAARCGCGESFTI